MINALNDFCNELFMNQYVTSPTHKDGNILDLVFTNNPSLVHDCFTVPVLQSTSHHSIVSVTTSYKAQDACKGEEKRPPLTGFKALNFFNTDTNWEQIRSKLKETKWNEELNDEDPNTILDKFYAVCLDVTNESVPKKTQEDEKKTNKIIRYRQKLSRRRRKITKRLSQVKSDLGKQKITNELLQIEKDLQKSFKKSDMYMEDKAVKAIKSNSKYFFSYAKKKSKIRSKIGPLLDKLGNLTSNNKEMAEILSQQYVSVFSKPTDNSTQSDNVESTVPNIPSLQMTEKDFISAIDELSPSAAAGPDGFPAILLKNCKEELSTPLLILWNKSLEIGIVPDRLKSSIITPIHKGDKRSLPANYRPIALTSHLIKLFEKILRAHIVKHMNDQNLFNESQHGFRSGRSCLSQLLEQYDLILDILEDGANADVVYLDFAKAFDKVNHTIVLQKINKMGIKGNIYQWLKSFLLNRVQCVSVDGTLSDPQPVISGVPQGSVLGPLIFLILIGDIDSEVLHAVIKSFADDTRATKGINSLDDVQNLQEDLDKIYKWSKDNSMELNDLKFELLRYGLNLLLKNSGYTTPNGDAITTKTEVKDLGVIMSNDGLFTKQIDAVCVKAKNVISWILRTFKTRCHSAMMTLYKSLVIPLLEYCSVLWSPLGAGQIQKLEMMQWSFLRKFTSHGKNYWDCLKSNRIYSLQRRRDRYRIIYIWKVLEGLVPSIKGITSKDSHRRGRSCNLPSLDGKVAKLREASLAYQGAKLFNALPKDVRKLKNVPLAKFKSALDAFLSKVPDEPQIAGYTAGRRASSNCVYHMAEFSGCFGANSI